MRNESFNLKIDLFKNHNKHDNEKNPNPLHSSVGRN